MAEIDVIYWGLHMIVFGIVLRYSIDFRRCLLQRVKFYTLAVAFMCFGVGRFLAEFSGDVTWIFNIGYVALSAFGLLYAYSQRLAK